jgi:drug/metabolite transporter (DMT)-like permease
MSLTATHPPPARLWTAHLTCMLAMMAWSTGLPANTFLLPVLHPVALAMLRLVLGAAILLPIWLAQDGTAALRRADWRTGLAIGGLVGLGSMAVIVGQVLTDAVTVAVISAAVPVIGLATEIVLDGRRLTLVLLTGLGLALAGGLLALGAGLSGVTFGLGALCCLGSTVLYTLGSRWTVTALPGLTPLGQCTITMVGGGVAMALIYACIVPTGLAEGPDFAAMGWREWGALLVFVVGSLTVSQILWVIAVGRLGIGMSALHINATPFYVMLMAVALGGAWNWWQAGGAALVGLGVLVAQGSPQRLMGRG